MQSVFVIAVPSEGNPRRVLSYSALALPWAVPPVTAGQRARDPHRAAASAGVRCFGEIQDKFVNDCWRITSLENCNCW